MQGAKRCACGRPSNEHAGSAVALHDAVVDVWLGVVLLRRQEKMKLCHVPECKRKASIPTVVGEDIRWFCRRHQQLVRINEFITELAGVPDIGCITVGEAALFRRVVVEAQE